MKEKNKIKIKFKNILACHARIKGLALAAFAFLSLFTNAWNAIPASAAVLQSKDISVDFGITPDNFFRTYLPSGSVGFNYTIRLGSPSQLTFYSGSYRGAGFGVPAQFVLDNPDKVDYLIQQDPTHAIGPLSLMFVSSNNISSSCSVSNTGWFRLGDSLQGCRTSINSKPVSGPGGNWSGAVWKAGETLVGSASTTLSASDLKSLGVTKASASGEVNSFYVCLGYSTASNVFMDPADGCKQVFIQLYDNETNYKAHLSDGRPNGVDQNGNVTSSPGINKGGGLTELINDIITAIASFIIKILYFVFSLIILPFITAILGVHPYQDSFVNVIYIGWQILRNVSNIVFIIAVIVMGIATLLRASGYEYKHMLVELIIAALLVNFSLVIGQSILALADTVQSQFLPNNQKVINTLASKVMPTNIKEIVQKSDYAKDHVFGTALDTVFIMAMAVAAFGVFAAIAVYLCIRVVALWLLLMVSPLAYAARVLPNTHHFESDWWGAFIKYAFFTPLMAFFLNLTAVIADQYPNILSTLNGNQTFDTSNALVNLFLNASTNIILLVFLYASLKVAEEFSIFGSHTITNIVQQGMFAPFKVAGNVAMAPVGGLYMAGKAGVGLGYQKIQERTAPWLAEGTGLKKIAGAALNPGAIKKAWAERRDERRHAASHLAEAGASMAIQKFWGEKPMDELSEAVLHGAQEQKKKFAALTGEEANLANLENLTENMGSGKDPVDKERWLGQVLKLVEDKGLNEVLKQANRFGARRNYTADALGLNAFLADMVEQKKLTEGEAGHLLTEISDIAYKNKEYWYAENFNTHHGHPVRIEMVKNEEGEYEPDEYLVMGRKTYYDIQDEVDAAMIREGNAEVERLVERAKPEGGFKTPEEEQNIRGIYQQQVRKEREKKIVETKDEHTQHGYSNFKRFLDSKEERSVNYKKSASQADARDGHYTRFNRFDAKGEAEFNDLGIDFISQFDYTRARQSNEWNPQTTNSSLKSYYNHMNKNLLDVRERIKSAQGVSDISAGIQSVLRTNAFKGIFLDKSVPKDEAKKAILDGISAIAKKVAARGTYDKASLKTEIEANAELKTLLGTEIDNAVKDIVSTIEAAPPPKFDPSVGGGHH